MVLYFSYVVDEILIFAVFRRCEAGIIAFTEESFHAQLKQNTAIVEFDTHVIPPLQIHEFPDHVLINAVLANGCVFVLKFAYDGAVS